MILKNGQNGSAVGFKINLLPKLIETRTNEPQVTVHHYVCELLEKEFPEKIPFLEKLESLKEILG